MRIDYVTDLEAFTDPEDKAIIQRVRERRGSVGLLPLDKALFHSPPVANGWNTFLGSIRTSTKLAPSLLESAICRIAVLNRAWFEWEQHAPILLAAQGATPAYLSAIFTTSPGLWHTLVNCNPDDRDNALSDGSETGPVPDEAHALVLEFTDSLTLEVSVSPGLFERVREKFGEREIVEISATVGAYNCVSRFLVALDVGERLGEQGMKKAVEFVGGMDKDLRPAPRTYANGS